MAPQINPSEALALYQSGKSLREVGAQFGIKHGNTIKRLLESTGCYAPHVTKYNQSHSEHRPRSPLAQAQRWLMHYEAKTAHWKQRVEELQKAAE
jgi:hypothetical protein